jgi:hypothetical protein
MSIATGLILLCASLSSAAGVSGTTLHQKHGNWLQLQVDSVGACQEIAVDSLKALDDGIYMTQALGDSGSIQVLSLYIGNVPRKDLRVWWRIKAAPSGVRCGQVKSARHLFALANPLKRAGSDTILENWAVGRIDAVGPNGMRDTIQPTMVDQAGDFVFNMNCVLSICDWNWNGEDTPEKDFLTTMKGRLAAGLPVVRIGAVNGAQTRRDSIPATQAYLATQGIPVKWNAGFKAMTESLPLKLVQSWGTPAFTNGLERPLDRVVQKWVQSARPCSDATDSLCYPAGDTLASTGVELEFSNDSTFSCYTPGLGLDADLPAQVAANDWLLLPDTSEVRQQKLIGTLGTAACVGRRNAYLIRNDSVAWGNTYVPLSLLDQALGIRRNRGKSGMRGAMRAYSLAGQRLPDAKANNPQPLLPLPVRGVVMR